MGQHSLLGSDGLTIWNAEIITTKRAFWDMAEEMAHTRAWELLTLEEQKAFIEQQLDRLNLIDGKRPTPVVDYDALDDLFREMLHVCYQPG